MTLHWVALFQKDTGERIGIVVLKMPGPEPEPIASALLEHVPALRNMEYRVSGYTFIERCTLPDRYCNRLLAPPESATASVMIDDSANYAAIGTA